MTMTNSTARHQVDTDAYAVHVHWRNGIHRRYTFDTFDASQQFASDLWGQRYDRPEPDGTPRLARVATFWRGQPLWEADTLTPHGAWVELPR